MRTETATWAQENNGEALEYVRDLDGGDVISWAGRWVTVVDTKPVALSHGSRRHGRYLIVHDPESGDHQLHYYADEWVKVRG